MFRKIDYRTETRFEPVRVIRVKPENRKYNEWYVIIGKSLLREEKNYSDKGTILELMKGMNK